MKSNKRTSSLNLRNVLICVTLMIVLGGSSLARAADWPNYRGPAYDGISQETGWQSTWQEAPEFTRARWKLGYGWLITEPP